MYSTINISIDGIFLVNKLTMKNHFTIVVLRKNRIAIVLHTTRTIVYFCKIARSSKYYKCHACVRSKICMTWAKVVDSNTKYVQPIYVYVNIQVVCNSRCSELKRWIHVTHPAMAWFTRVHWLPVHAIRYCRYRPLRRSVTVNPLVMVWSKESNQWLMQLKVYLIIRKILFRKITRNVF